MGQSTALSAGAEAAIKLVCGLPGAARESLSEATPEPGVSWPLCPAWEWPELVPGTQSHGSLSLHSGLNHLHSTGRTGPNALVQLRRCVYHFNSSYLKSD